jgi:putative ABC transport system substrate-binding protein
VVFVTAAIPSKAGYADSLPRPGRNATGISLMALDLIVKRMDFLKQCRPAMRRIAFLASPEHAGTKTRAGRFARGSRKDWRRGRLFRGAHASRAGGRAAGVVSAKPDAALLFSDALMVGQRQELAAFFLKHRIPSASGFSAFPDSGHLLSYGPERKAVWRRTADFVDRIIKGARPADLPIELPTVFELVVNRRTASEMGLALPQAMLVGADRIVD